MLKPLNKCVYVKPDAPLLKRGNLFMPPSDNRQCHGIVQTSGSELCKAGDRVLYARFWPTTFMGEDLMVVDERDLVGVDPDPVIDADAQQPMAVQVPDAGDQHAGPGLLVPPMPQVRGPRGIVH